MILGATIKLKDQFTPVMKQAKKGTEEMSKSMKLAGLQANRMKKDFKDAYEAAKPKNMFDSAKQTGTAMTAAGAGIAAGLGFAVKKAAEFEGAMSQVAAISGASGSELDALTKAARDAGAATSKTATEAANALNYMALAGWDNKTSMDALMPVLRLSEAGNLDLARTSDLVTDSMSALGINVKALPTFLDQVAKTAGKSNTNIDALMEAMLQAGGTFKGLNVPLDEANALLGVLANRGKKGAEAGNSMRSIMVNLTAPTGRAEKALKDLGLSAFDSQGNFKGMTNVLLELSEKTSGMTEEQRNMYLSMIGGKEQLATLQALLSGVGDEYGQLRTDIQNSEGALEDMAKVMRDNLLGSLEELSSAGEEMAISIGEVLTPYIRGAAEHLKNLADKFNKLSPEAKKTIAITAAVAAGFLLIGGPLLILIGMLPALAAGFALLFSPVTLIVLGILALIAVGILLYKNWDKIKEKAGDIWDTVKNTIAGFIDNMVGKFNSFKEKVFKIWDDIKTFIKNPIKGTVNLVTGGGKTKGHASGLPYVPYDNYPALLHRGETVLTRAEADQQRSGSSVTIAKIADTIVVREDADIDKIANALAAKLRQSASNRGRVVTA